MWTRISETRVKGDTFTSVLWGVKWLPSLTAQWSLSTQEWSWQVPQGAVPPPSFCIPKNLPGEKQANPNGWPEKSWWAGWISAGGWGRVPPEPDPETRIWEQGVCTRADYRQKSRESHRDGKGGNVFSLVNNQASTLQGTSRRLCRRRLWVVTPKDKELRMYLPILSSGWLRTGWRRGGYSWAVLPSG